MRLSLAVLFLFSAVVNAETYHQFHLETFLQHRELNQKGYTEKNSVQEIYFLADVLFQYSKNSFYFEAKPQIRAVESPEPVSVETSHRVLNSMRVISDEGSHEVSADFDRLNIRYGKNNWEVFAGRRPISLGVLRFFPVWNKLTLPLVFGPGPQWIENPDVIGGSFQRGAISTRVFAARGDEPQEDDLVLGELRYFGSHLEAQFLVGHWWQSSAAGLALSTDWLEATWRLEALGLAGGETEDQAQLGLGFERALDAKWTIVSEYYGQTLCRRRNDGYGVIPPSQFQVLNGCHYLLPYASYQWSDLLSLSAGTLVNLTDTSLVGILGGGYQWSDEVTLEAKATLPFGPSRSEFGPARFSDLFGRELGAQSTVYVSLLATF